MASSQDTLQLVGHLVGHNDWITQIVTSAQSPGMLLSSSRDKTMICWKLNADTQSSNIGSAQRALRGHNHFVSDIALSNDSQHALSGSWDNTMRLWDLKTGQTTRKFECRGNGHTKDILSVAFSPDNRQILSSSRDNEIKLWNTLGEYKHTMGKDAPGDKHTDWVSCVRFSPAQNPIIVSTGWDKVVKVWELATCKLKVSHYGHTGYVNSVTVSPDGSLCASGGKDGSAMLWDLNKDEGKHLYTLGENETKEINTLCFSPTRYWLCTAVGNAIKIWDLENKTIVDTLTFHHAEHSNKAQDIECTSLAWAADGETLFAGFTDNIIRVWRIAKGGMSNEY